MSINPRKSQHITTTIVVPVFNEEKGLAVVLSKLFKLKAFTENGYEVIVIDDGSTDKTGEVARKFPCRLVKHEQNRGKGEALRTGIKNARGSNVIWIDGDDTYPVEAIPQLVDALVNYDIVVGSRVDGTENIPVFNQFGNWIFRTMIKIIYGFKPHDPCTGLYGAKKSLLEAMKLSSKRFAIEPEISIKGSRMKLQMADIPITYQPRIGNAKLSAIRAGFENLQTILGLLRWDGNSRRSKKIREMNPGKPGHLPENN